MIQKVIIGAQEVSLRLSQRLTKREVEGLCCEILSCGYPLESLCDLLFYGEDRTSWNAGWLLNHVPKADLKQLICRRDDLMDFACRCAESGRLRFALNLIASLPDGCVNRPDFIDFCFKEIQNARQTPAVRSLCLKLAYRLCRSVDDALVSELMAVVQLIQSERLPPSINCTIKSIHRASEKNKR